MQKETKEIIKLTTKEILSYLDYQFDNMLGPVDLMSRKPLRAYFYQNYPVTQAPDWQDFERKVQRLRHRGYIRKITEGKEYYHEITPSGKAQLSKLEFRNLQADRVGKWDKKWRIVIYDIPEDDRELRDAIRRKLYQIGFLQVQKSVFVYPFECTKAVNLICQRYGERHCIKFMIADIIEGEESITEIFFDKGTLRTEDLI